jgi:hypothetical protein
VNEYTVEISNTTETRTEVVTVKASNWMKALDVAVYRIGWAMKAKVLTQNGSTFAHSVFVKV